MALTTAQQVDMLGVYLADPGDEKISRTLKVQMLNNAQRIVTIMLRPHLRNALQVLEEDLPLDSDGFFDLNNLSNTIRDHHTGINMVRYDGGRPADLMSIDELKELRFLTQTPNTDSPKYIQWGDKIQCWPHSGLTDVATGSIEEGEVYYNLGYTTVTYNGVEYTDTKSFTGVAGVTAYTTTGTGIVAQSPQLIDIYYEKTPADLVEGTQDCEYDDRVTEIITMIACGSLNQDQYQIGMMQIEKYNEEYRPTDSNRVGRSPEDAYYMNRRPDNHFITISHGDA